MKTTLTSLYFTGVCTRKKHCTWRTKMATMTSKSNFEYAIQYKTTVPTANSCNFDRFFKNHEQCIVPWQTAQLLLDYVQQRSRNLRKLLQIYAVSNGVVLVIMRTLCILFKSLLLSHFQPPSPCRNKNMEISCESTDVQ